MNEELRKKLDDLVRLASALLSEETNEISAKLFPCSISNIDKLRVRKEENHLVFTVVDERGDSFGVHLNKDNLSELRHFIGVFLEKHGAK